MYYFLAGLSGIINGFLFFISEMSGQTTPTPEEMQQLLYGDLGEQPESSHGSQAGAMDLDEGLLEEDNQT
jgi:hypothetical protein